MTSAVVTDQHSKVHTGFGSEPSLKDTVPYGTPNPKLILFCFYQFATCQQFSNICKVEHKEAYWNANLSALCGEIKVCWWFYSFWLPFYWIAFQWLVFAEQNADDPQIVSQDKVNQCKK